MASVKAAATHTAFVLTAAQKGEQGNLLRVKALADPAGTTGATTVSVSGPDITVKCKNTTGTISATVAEVYAALSGSTAVQRLATLTAGSATGANTGAAFTGSDGGFVNFSAGAESGSAVVYDTLAEADADHWNLLNVTTGDGDTFDVLETIIDGVATRQAAAAATGATSVVLAAGRSVDKWARKGLLGSDREG